MKNNENKKFNPFKSVAFCLCSLMFVASFALFAVSLALSLVDITAGGHISFTASGVYAKVTGSVTGTKTTNTLDTLNFDASTESFTTPDSWKNMTLDFTNDNLITFTVNFQNLSDENPMYVFFDYSLYDDTRDMTSSPLTTTITLDNTTITTFPALEVPTSTAKTLVITFKVDNMNINSEYEFSLKMELNKDKIDDVQLDDTVRDYLYYKDYGFGINDYCIVNDTDIRINGTGLYSDDGWSSSFSGDLIVPTYLIYNGEQYKVVGAVAGPSFCETGTINNIFLPHTLIDITEIKHIIDCFQSGYSTNIKIDKRNTKYYSHGNKIYDKETNALVWQRDSD